MLSIVEISWVEFAKTEEAQNRLRWLNQCSNEIGLLVKELDLSTAPLQWLCERIVDWLHQSWDIHSAVPAHLYSTAAEDRLSFALSHIESPKIVLDAVFKIALGARCVDEILRRMPPVALNVMRLRGLPHELRNEITLRSPFDYEKDALEALMQILQPHTHKLYLPQEAGTSEAWVEKEAEMRQILWKEMSKLPEGEDFLIQALADKFEKLPLRIKSRLISKIRKQNAQKRTPEGGIQSLDEEIELPDGSSVPVGLLLGEEDPQLEKVDEDFTQEQLDALDKELGPIGREIFVYRYRHQEIIGRGEGRIIAKKLGYATSTVSKYLEIIEAKAPVIKKIMMG